MKRIYWSLLSYSLILSGYQVVANTNSSYVFGSVKVTLRTVQNILTTGSSLSGRIGEYYTDVYPSLTCNFQIVLLQCEEWTGSCYERNLVQEVISKFDANVLVPFFHDPGSWYFMKAPIMWEHLVGGNYVIPPTESTNYYRIIVTASSGMTSWNWVGSNDGCYARAESNIFSVVPQDLKKKSFKGK